MLIPITQGSHYDFFKNVAVKCNMVNIPNLQVDYDRDPFPGGNSYPNGTVATFICDDGNPPPIGGTSGTCIYYSWTVIPTCYNGNKTIAVL